MRRAGVIVVLLAVALAPAAAGCGSDERVRLVRAWPSEPPYLPPPDLAQQPAQAGERRASAGEREAAAAGDGPPSDDDVARDLREAYGLEDGASTADLVDGATVGSDGEASVPPGAPARVAQIIRGANEVARKPYVYGGGHGRLADETWIDTAYDCSGSISFALATAGLIDAPMASGALARWGSRGPGRWVTIYANDGHAFMTVAGLRFDTSGRREAGTRWQAGGRPAEGFRVRHPPGL